MFVNKSLCYASRYWVAASSIGGEKLNPFLDLVLRHFRILLRTKA